MSKFEKIIIGISVGMFVVGVIYSTLNGNHRFIELWFSYKVLSWALDFFRDMIKDAKLKSKQ